MSGPLNKALKKIRELEGLKAQLRRVARKLEILKKQARKKKKK